MPIPQAMDDMNRQFVEAFNRGDATGCAIVYTPGARLLPPDAAIVQGRPAIGAFWEAMMASGARAVERETVDVEIDGNMGREVGLARLHIQGPDGSVAVQPLKYVVVWKCEGENTWKWDVDIWNETPIPTT